MGLIRLFLLFLVVWAAVKFLKGLMAPKSGPEPRPARARGAGPRPVGGELVQDPQCGVYVPKETALQGSDGAYFCSEACRRAHETRGGDHGVKA